jgi:ankyrin repeat protein
MREQKKVATPLQFAAYDGHLRAAERLISAYKKRGKIKEIDAHDKEGTSALQYAASGPRGGMNREVAELLVTQGADPTQFLNNQSPLLSLSAVAGNLAMVEYWIEDIAHTNLFSREQEKDFIERGIKLARRNRHTDIVIILQDYYKRMCV